LYFHNNTSRRNYSLLYRFVINEFIVTNYE
jgi:hypothetical protein